MIEKLKIFFRTYLKDYSRKSYSQEGEDILLTRIFGENKKTGFFIDIGAHHPTRFSNTHLFYKLGWRGINIDPNPLAIKAFNYKRKGDININIGISQIKGTLDYYSFDDPALNTFDKELAEIRKNSVYKLKEILSINVISLGDLLDAYKISQPIDFMSVDVEGFDLEVLKSNNWQKYKPNYLVVEILEKDISTIYSTDICIYLNNLGYLLHSKLVHSVIFKHESI